MAINNLTITVVDGGNKSSSKSSSSKRNKKTEDESVDKDSTLYKVLNVGSEIKTKMKSSMTPAQYFSFEMGTRIAISTLKQTANYFIFNYYQLIVYYFLFDSIIDVIINFINFFFS